MTIQVEGMIPAYPASGSGPAAAAPLSFRLEAGEITIIAGQTGSGKSTLLRMLAGLQAPCAGNVLYRGQPLWRKGKAQRSLMSRIGYLAQYPEDQLFAATVEEEFRFSLKGTGMNREQRLSLARDTLAVLGLDEGVLEKSPFHLSGGEKRKVALAALTAASPAGWLLLDEPSSCLDSGSAADLRHWLEGRRALTKEAGTIIATHDLDLFLPIADRVILLRHGAVVWEGEPDELIRSPWRLEKAGIGVPALVRLAALAGYPKADGKARLALDPAGLALATRKRPRGEIKLPALGSSKPQAAEGQPQEEAFFMPEASSPAMDLDPRGKWLAYLLFSAGVLLTREWSTAIAGLMMLSLISRLVSVPVSRWTKPFLPYACFMAIATMIAGVQLPAAFIPWNLGGISYSWENGLETARRLFSILPVMGGGLLFTAVTRVSAMKNGMEAALRAVPGGKKLAEPAAMTASLLFRFLDIIGSDIRRFSLIAASRGKRGGRPGRLGITRLTGFLTPLLLSLLLHAEEMAIAMEGRGYGRKDVSPTPPDKLVMKRRDWGVASLGALMLALLLGIASLL